MVRPFTLRVAVVVAVALAAGPAVAGSMPQLRASRVLRVDHLALRVPPAFAWLSIWPCMDAGEDENSLTRPGHDPGRSGPLVVEHARPLDGTLFGALDTVWSSLGMAGTAADTALLEMTGRPALLREGIGRDRAGKGARIAVLIARVDDEVHWLRISVPAADARTYAALRAAALSTTVLTPSRSILAVSWRRSLRDPFRDPEPAALPAPRVLRSLFPVHGRTAPPTKASGW